MTVATAEPAEVAASDGPATPSRGAVCPRCGYDLSGLVASWRDACPLEAVCSECGLRFGCADVLLPRRHELARYFEHARGLRELFVWAWVTWAWAIAPWRFWSRVRMHHRLRPWRAALWPAWSVLPLHVLAAVIYAAAVGWQFAGLGPPAMAGVRSGELASAGNGLWRPFAAVSVLWSWPASSYTIQWPNEGGWTTGVWAGLAGTCMFGVLLAALPVTRRRAKVRAGHIWRAVGFGFAWVVPLAICNLIVTAFMARQLSQTPLTTGASILHQVTTTEDWCRYLLTRWWPLPVALVYGWTVWWWWLAISRGMQLPEARRHFLVLLVPVTIAVIAAVVGSQLNNTWFVQSLVRAGLR